MERIKIITKPTAQVKITSKIVSAVESPTGQPVLPKVDKFVRQSSTQRLTMPSLMKQESSKDVKAATSRLLLSQSTKSFVSQNTEQDFRLPKIKSHINANPKFIKTTYRLPVNYSLLQPFAEKLPSVVQKEEARDQQGCS